MAYQYRFEEGLEISLVPIQEAAPLSAGAKVLELGLNGFTGRMIVTKQISKRPTTVESLVKDKLGKNATDDESSSSSSSSESDGAAPRHAIHSKAERQTPRLELPKELDVNIIRPKTQQDPPSKIEPKEKEVSKEAARGRSLSPLRGHSSSPTGDLPAQSPRTHSSPTQKNLSPKVPAKPRETKSFPPRIDEVSIDDSSLDVSSAEPSEGTPKELEASPPKKQKPHAKILIAESKEKSDESPSTFGMLSGSHSRQKRVEKGSIDESASNTKKEQYDDDTQRSGKKDYLSVSENDQQENSIRGDPLTQYTTAVAALLERENSADNRIPDTVDEKSFTLSMNHKEDFNGVKESNENVSEKVSAAKATELPAGTSWAEDSPQQERKKPLDNNMGTPARNSYRSKRITSHLTPEKKEEIRKLFPDHPDNRIGENGSMDPVGAFLRKKCSEPLEGTITPKDLREMLEVFPYSAFCVDEKGRLSIHILADNGVLLKDSNGRKRAGKLAQILIQAYPESVACTDSFGRVPFVALLERWVTAQNIRKGDEKEEPPTSLWPHAEWCLSMMSMLLDNMVGTGLLKETFAPLSREEKLAARNQYVSALLRCVPNIIKTVLLLGNGAGKTRKRVESLSIIRRSLLCPESLGTWLQEIVRKYGTSSKIAMDYFVLLSQTKPEDLLGPKMKPEHHDIEAFYDQREKVYRAIEHLKVKIPKEEVERRALGI